MCSLMAGPQPTDVLDVLYHKYYVVISAWRCFALIIRNPGDNHVLRTLAHLVETPTGSQGPLRGPPGTSGPRPGAARGPRGGAKLSPPGDGRHLTDFVAN